MFSGPMFRWERKFATRRLRPFTVRTVLTALLVGLALLVGYGLSRSSGIDDQARRLLLGRSLVIGTIGLELLYLVFFVPAYVAGSIAEEREKDTLPLLLLTRLTPVEIVVTKAAARWLQAFHLVLAGFPVLAAGAWLSGLELEGALALLVLVSTSAFMASLAILASARQGQVGTARGEATGWIFGWLLGPPIVSIMPVATGSFWGDLLVELKGLAALVAPSSPVSLATDGSWYSSSATAARSGRKTLNSSSSSSARRCTSNGMNPRTRLLWKCEYACRTTAATWSPGRAEYFSARRRSTSSIHARSS